MHEASIKNKLKFIVLHKESNLFPGEVLAYTKRIKKLDKFSGSKILVYNKFIRKILIKSKFVNKNKIKCIGVPRGDYYYKIKSEKKNNQKKFIILILLINERRNKVNIKNSKYLKENYGLTFKDVLWKKLSYKMIKNLLIFAKLNPEIEFIFKSKRKLKNIEDYKEFNLQKILYEKNLQNCHVESEMNTGKLIRKASLVIGFNTTTLFEALILDKNIIVPKFGITNKSVIKNFTLDMKNTVFYANNEKKFINLLNKAYLGELEKRKNKRIIKNIIEQHIGNTDGKSTKRLINEL